jgi:hypothetical protein
MCYFTADSQILKAISSNKLNPESALEKMPRRCAKEKEFFE